jgi:hypothetical protein
MRGRIFLTSAPDLRPKLSLGTNPKAPFAAGQYPIVELPPVTNATSKTVGITFKIPADPASDAHYIVRSKPAPGAAGGIIKEKVGKDDWFGGPFSVTVTTGPSVAGLTTITVTELVTLDTTQRFHTLEARAP